MGNNLIKLFVVALLCFITFGCNQVDPVEEKCVITFDSDGGSEIQSIEIQKGNKISKPNDPVKEGCIFNGWYLNDEEWSFIGYIVTEDMTLKAKWEEKEYTVIFVSDNNIISEKKQKFNSPIDVPNDPVKEGYTFIGWDKELPQVMPSEDMTFNAEFEVNKYTITFVVDGAETKVTQDYNTEIIKPNDPVKEGYTFIGWDKELPQVMPSEDMTFNAEFEVNKYTITFVVDGAETKITQDYNTEIIKPNDPVKEGYTFIGWDKELPQVIPSEDLVLNAKWEVLKCVIKFYDGENLLKEITQDYGTKLEKLSAPNQDVSSKEGYIFGGWALDLKKSDLFEFNSVVTGDIELYAKHYKIVEIGMVVIDCDKEELKVGDSLKLKAVVYPTNQDDEAYQGVTWEIHESSISVATIDENGVVTGIKAGTLRVRAISIMNPNEASAYYIIKISN